MRIFIKGSPDITTWKVTLAYLKADLAKGSHVYNGIRISGCKRNNGIRLSLFRSMNGLQFTSPIECQNFYGWGARGRAEEPPKMPNLS